MAHWDREWAIAGVGLALAATGWWVGSSLLAIGGLLASATIAALWVWQRQALSSVTYDRRLGRTHALFGEEVALEIEVVNDKLLPLTWLHVGDQVPAGLEIRGASVRIAANGRRYEMHHLLPLLPYERVRRKMTVVCTNRGEHVFGPGVIESGDPVGLHRNERRIAGVERLLVYPKIFRLEMPPFVARLALGDRRGDPRLSGDPSRVAGVREYRQGDPLRHVDWRATARSTLLLVKEYEPTAALQMAVFADIRIPPGSGGPEGKEAVEFVVSVTASIVADLVRRKIPTALYSSGAVSGHPIAHRARTRSRIPAGDARIAGSGIAIWENLQRCRAIAGDRQPAPRHEPPCHIPRLRRRPERMPGRGPPAFARGSAVDRHRPWRADAS